MSPVPKFIVFEGLDGCGKTTQLKRLAEWLRERGEPVVTTREPGGTALGQHLRSLLLDPAEQIAPVAELLLYAADRAHHAAQVIAPSLSEGKWVLCDRFTDSTMAYQAYGRGISGWQVSALNHIATKSLPKPFTIWLKLSAEVALARRQGCPPDRIESSGLPFYERVQAGFEAIAYRHPERVHTVDGADSEAEIALAIQDLIRERYEL